MARGVVTITTAGSSEIERGMRLTTSTGTGPSQTFWVIGQKSATELIIAATWRDSLWVLWFQFVAWITGKWVALRSRLRRDDDLDEKEEDDPPLFVPPADDSTDEVTKDPKMLN